jgi:hypothetical protein
LARHFFRGDVFTVVNVQRTAAGLLLREDDFATVAPEHAHGGGIDGAEQ